MRIHVPKHLTCEAGVVYRETINYLVDAKIYHKSDKHTIESYANLVISVRNMEVIDPVPKETVAHYRCIIAMTAKLEATQKALGLCNAERRKRDPSVKQIGRPKKNAGVEGDEKTQQDWLRVLDGGKP